MCAPNSQQYKGSTAWQHLLRVLHIAQPWGDVVRKLCRDCTSEAYPCREKWHEISRCFETVAELPGLSSPCTMKCGKGLLPAFGVGFTPHIQRKARTDLLVRPHPVDTFLHLAIAPVAPLHCVRGGGQQLVIEKCEGLFQGGEKEFLQGLTQ